MRISKGILSGQSLSAKAKLVAIPGFGNRKLKKTAKLRKSLLFFHMSDGDFSTFLPTLVSNRIKVCQKR